MNDNIQRINLTTKSGNTVEVFYNPENDLLVVDLMNDNGGNELLRQTLNEEKLLEHTK